MAIDKVTPTINLQPNVIDGEELQELFKTVFAQMSKYVSRTYGPFGENTAYQEGGKILTTKDGWSVEQSIIYSNSVLASIIRKMIIDVSTAINSRAGDGTTTGLIAANEINNLIMNYKREHKVHTKFLSNTIQYCVDKICTELNASAIRVTDENLEDVIYKIASVSLDWDTEYAGFIRDIYKNTGNTVIRVQDSGTEHSFVEYRDGYDISAKLLSEFKVNVLGEKKYTMDNPTILVFSYTLNAGMFEPLLNVATLLHAKLGKELVVVAPNFEKDFRDSYNTLCIRMARAKQPLPSMVMVKYFAEFNIEREMLIDFSFLTGATIISKEYNEAEEIIREFLSIIKQPEPNPEQYTKEQGSRIVPDEMAYRAARTKYEGSIRECGDEFIEKIAPYIGVCDSLTVDDKLLVVSGFGDIESAGPLQDRINTIQGEINKAMKDMNAKSMFTDEIKLKRTRLGKLRLKMGIIHVGGFGERQLKAKRDALDDAINACANAYTDGIILGGGLAIPLAIEKLRNRFNTGKWIPSNECNVDNKLVHDILTIIEDGFIRTWEIMMMNRYPDKIVDDINIDDYTEGSCTLRDLISTSNAINGQPVDSTTIFIRSLITYSINNKKPWNLITKQLDDGIIHPVRVETEVIKGCLNLVLTTTTTNQLLYSGYDGADKEIADMREVKE